MTDEVPGDKPKKKTRRGTSNKNQTGSSADRRARRLWLLKEFGDGVTAPCSFGCGTMLTLENLTVDRYPVPGYAGGKYVHGNIRPACGPCNSADGSRAGAERSKDRREALKAQLKGRMIRGEVDPDIRIFAVIGGGDITPRTVADALSAEVRDKLRTVAKDSDLGH